MFQELEDEGIEPFEVPNLYLGGNEPDTYVDITETIDTKVAALAEHVSEEGEAAAPWVRERAREWVRRQASSTPRPSRRSASWTTMSRRAWTIRDRTRRDRTSPRADRRGTPRHRGRPRRPGRDAHGLLAPGREGGRDRVPGLRLEPLLRVGAAARQPGADASRRAAPHEPAFELVEDEYIQWDYGKGYVDALAEPASSPTSASRSPSVPGARRRSTAAFAFCPTCGRTLGHGAPVPRAARSRLRRARRARAARARRLRTLLNPRGRALDRFGARWPRARDGEARREGGADGSRFMFKVSYTQGGHAGRHEGRRGQPA